MTSGWSINPESRLKSCGGTGGSGVVLLSPVAHKLVGSLGSPGAADVGWIANEADPEGGVRSLARPGARLSTIHATKGAPGDRPGGCKRALERTFFSRTVCSPPPGGPGLKAVLERPCSPIPGEEGEDLLKGSRVRGISGE